MLFSISSNFSIAPCSPCYLTVNGFAQQDLWRPRCEAPRPLYKCLRWSFFT